jgi:hypothetical protein
LPDVDYEPGFEPPVIFSREGDEPPFPPLPKINRGKDGMAWRLFSSHMEVRGIRGKGK